MIMRPASKSILPSDLDKGAFVLAQKLPHNSKRRVVFVDRDGTINLEKGYVIDPQDIKLAPTTGDSISSLNRHGIPVIVITNQTAIGKGLLTVETFEKINEKLWGELQAVNAHYDALYYCSHSPEITADCPCRKPEPGLLLQAARDFDIDLPGSFMIGDKLTDVRAGHASGCKTVLLLSGHGETQDRLAFSEDGSRPDFTCDTLAEAIDWILPQILKNDGLKIS